MYGGSHKANYIINLLSQSQHQFNKPYGIFSNTPTKLQHILLEDIYSLKITNFNVHMDKKNNEQQKLNP